MNIRIYASGQRKALATITQLEKFRMCTLRMRDDFREQRREKYQESGGRCPRCDIWSSVRH
ncbi:hypothetical protein E2C01_028104 [Portunus trituberculatus]|uniref:Uncharacterized protein n=1 Tax=Portunus trituberculatus TaxID=210409 RepID=A0A5B7EMR4_PORTR|nr:hypothetical protein [Portunus trituberculatus]